MLGAPTIMLVHLATPHKIKGVTAQLDTSPDRHKNLLKWDKLVLELIIARMETNI